MSEYSIEIKFKLCNVRLQCLILFSKMFNGKSIDLSYEGYMICIAYKNKDTKGTFMHPPVTTFLNDEFGGFAAAKLHFS